MHCCAKASSSAWSPRYVRRTAAQRPRFGCSCARHSGPSILAKEDDGSQRENHGAPQGISRDSRCSAIRYNGVIGGRLGGASGLRGVRRRIYNGYCVLFELRAGNVSLPPTAGNMRWPCRLRLLVGCPAHTIAGSSIASIDANAPSCRSKGVFQGARGLGPRAGRGVGALPPLLLGSCLAWRRRPWPLYASASTSRASLFGVTHLLPRRILPSRPVVLPRRASHLFCRFSQDARRCAAASARSTWRPVRRRRRLQRPGGPRRRRRAPTPRARRTRAGPPPRRSHGVRRGLWLQREQTRREATRCSAGVPSAMSIFSRSPP